MLAPTVPALSLLSMDPSHAVVASAHQAAATRHGLVNLTRLVRSLDKQRAANAAEERNGSTWVAVQKNWEMVLYARALLQALRSSNEGSSGTAAALTALDKTLAQVEAHVQATAKNTPSPAPIASLPQFKLPASALTIPTAAALLSDDAPAEGEEVPVPLSAAEEEAPLQLDFPVAPVPTLSASASPALSSAPVLSPAITTSASKFDTSQYFAKRAREDGQGGEAGLLPLKVQKKNPDGEDVLDQEGMRQRLMGGGAARGMGASQLHEELGGQLVDMSKQLKKNALHFSNALEEEKTLMQTSQDVLESNLEKTKKSKGQLATVSTSRGSTTCMTLGIIITVIVLFIWTYMLIRFT